MTDNSIDWKMEAERANRLLSDAQRIISEYKVRAVEVARARETKSALDRDQIIRTIEGRMVSYQGYSSPMLAAAIADAISVLSQNPQE